MGEVTFLNIVHRMYAKGGMNEETGKENSANTTIGKIHIRKWKESKMCPDTYIHNRLTTPLACRRQLPGGCLRLGYNLRKTEKDFQQTGNVSKD